MSDKKQKKTPKNTTIKVRVNKAKKEEYQKSLKKLGIKSMGTAIDYHLEDTINEANS